MPTNNPPPPSCTPTTHPPTLQAKEFGEAEVWMNERMSRAAPDACARFLGAFQAPSATGPSAGKAVGGKAPLGKRAPVDDDVWLVWADEGDATLSDLMTVRGGPCWCVG
jgi:hypothetical protein